MIPAEIKAARNALGMSVGQFAAWLGLEGESGRELVRAWENGKKPITGPAARAIKTGLCLKDARSALMRGPRSGTLLDEIDEALHA